MFSWSMPLFVPISFLTGLGVGGCGDGIPEPSTTFSFRKRGVKIAREGDECYT